VVVTSRVLNEGVDVPEASLAVVLSGTGSPREYVQRLGRIVRRREGKLAVLYEVVAEATCEEQIARRRRPGPPVRAACQRDERAPELFADHEAEAPVSQRPRYGQEDDRSYPPTC
jgi:superfamily II DNA or RNA helicase